MIRKLKLFTDTVGCYRALPLEEMLVGTNEFGVRSAGNISHGTMRENALTGRSSAAGPHLKAARCVVEGREDADKEDV